ncbi:MAG: hypothetical protein CMP33_04240 [Rickettsiales bacterium]|nr:hypothetical protein [Rickettsiales bacterium]|tara:strand:+ start:246 stop:584 length:339 start_codon:yes stop_codon:yes gene_type:complete
MIGYLVAFVFVNILVTPDVLAGAKTYGATKPYTLEQQIRRGERNKVKMTTARRVYMGHIGDNLVCIYVGAGKSNETIVTGKDDRCMGSMMVPYAPDPSYDWKDTLKKMQKDY